MPWFSYNSGCTNYLECLYILVNSIILKEKYEKLTIFRHVDAFIFWIIYNGLISLQIYWGIADWILTIDFSAIALFLLLYFYSINWCTSARVGMVLRQGISFLISWVGSCLTRTRGYLRYPTGKHRGRESKHSCILYPCISSGTYR